MRDLEKVNSKLLKVNIGTKDEVNEVQIIASMLVDPLGGGLNSYWQKLSQGFFVGLIIHILYKGKREETDTTLQYIREILNRPQSLWQEMRTYSHFDSGNHPIVGAAGSMISNLSERESESLLVVVNNYLSECGVTEACTV